MVFKDTNNTVDLYKNSILMNLGYMKEDFFKYL
jgi:hypothetical protein